ncbi:MAG: SRPBCC domain-containing protein [Marinilabiliaceae bacterium]|jgi:carbon monoxide dehydrogenase subunit G|nr:SRPBCC domain-containing protein [Marinilabiliaceae bacterium]
MEEFSKYESRVGKIKRAGRPVYAFITDMRNFQQFLPGESITNWQAEKNSCEFEVSPVGKTRLKIVDMEENKVVKYEGDGLNNTSFFLWVQLKEIDLYDTRVKITIKADLNAMLRMMAAKPINDFLEKLVTGMENFDGWIDSD